MSPEDERLMPPKKKGGPLPKEQIETLLNWIEQGALWADGITLVPRKPEEAPGANEGVTVAEIHRMILAKLEVTTEKDMRSYTNTIPGTQVASS